MQTRYQHPNRWDGQKDTAHLRHYSGNAMRCCFILYYGEMEGIYEGRHRALWKLYFVWRRRERVKHAHVMNDTCMVCSIRLKKKIEKRNQSAYKLVATAKLTLLPAANS